MNLRLDTVVEMHSVIIPNDKPSLTLLCFLLLTLASGSTSWSRWGASATLTSSVSDSVLFSSTPKTTTATGLDRLKEALNDDDKRPSTDTNEKKVKYASGLWLTASKISKGSTRKKRSSSDYHNLHQHSPWKNSRRSRIHESSAAMSENIVPSSSHEQPQMSEHLRAAGREMAVQMMSKRRGGMGGGRMYDVPQIECPRSEDRMERFACPSPDFRGRYRCIDDRSLCDGFFDCPSREDENPDMCLFYKTTKAHLDILAEALLRWARGR